MWKSQYCRHNAAVRNLVPEDQLLEFNAKQGQGRLHASQRTGAQLKKFSGFRLIFPK